MSSRRAFGLFIASAVLFGGTFVGAKAGLPYFPPLTFVAIRFDIGAIVLAGYAAYKLSLAELQPRTRGDVIAILATGVFVIGSTNALIFIGQQYTTSGVAAIIMSLNPILTPVFAAFALSDESLTRRGVVGIVAGLIGVGLVANPDPSAFIGSVGLPIIFGAAVMSALGTVIIRWATPTMSSAARTVWGVPIAAIVTHLLAATAGESMAAISVTPIAVIALLYVGIGSGAIAYLSYFALIDTVGATRANLLFYLTPVVSALGGWIILDETISMLTITGFAVILGGFLIIGGDSITAVITRRHPQIWTQWMVLRGWIISLLPSPRLSYLLRVIQSQIKEPQTQTEEQSQSHSPPPSQSD
jgi:Permeases of the drug/metabolite transporter (DMT) superfamily